MISKPCYSFDAGCAADLFGCGGVGKCAVVDASEVPFKPLTTEQLDGIGQVRGRGL